MGLSSLYNKIASISPYAEIALRHLYWHNVGLLKKLNPNKAPKHRTSKEQLYVDFEKVIDWLKGKGVGEGSLLIVHSSYGGLECTKLSPEQIVDRLLELVGPTGTLCMPAIRRFKEEEKAKKDGVDINTVVCKYNVLKTVITSGMLPYTLMHKDGAVISHFPYNPLCAVGPLAKKMMLHNLDGKYPSPHGPNSSWKYCLDHNAFVCSIGTDIEHHNTIMHVAEEAYDNWRWTSKEWYDHRTFEITDEQKNVQTIVVSNRKDGWGTLHIAEINACNDEKKYGAMYSDMIDDIIPVGFVYPQKMISLFHSKNKEGYPYFLFPWQKAAAVQ